MSGDPSRVLIAAKLPADAMIATAMIATILIYAATKPDTFHVQRSTHIAAPPEKVFELIEDLHHWASWSPWEKRDPAMKKSYSGAPQGAGAALDWLTAAFGFRERFRHLGESGWIDHAEMSIGDGLVMLARPSAAASG